MRRDRAADRRLWMRLLRAGALLAVAAASVAAQDRAAVERALAELRATPALAGARVGVMVEDLGSGQVLAESDADRGFLTASNMKLLTAAVALRTLGPDFTWTTRVVAATAPHDGTIDGDLFLVGDGDPSLGGRPHDDAMATMRQLAQRLAAAGVQRVRGRVLGCGSGGCRELYGRGWQWDYLDEDYAAPCADLNFAENVATLALRAADGGGAPQLRELPFAGALLFELDVRAAAADQRPELHFTRPFGAERVRVRGTVGAEEQMLRVAVTSPERFAAQALRAALLAAGIEVTGEATADDGGPPAAAVTLASEPSLPLLTLMRPMLKHSINLYAEQFWRTAGRRGAAATTSDGCEQHATAVLQQLGVPTAGLVLADGSGLSRRDLVQPAQLVALLTRIHADPQLQPIGALLPVGGVDGTLHGRLGDAATRGHVRAKTGFVSFVACLSGYLDRPGKAPPLAFAVMLNNYTCATEQAKAAIDGFVGRLAVASGWTQ